MSLTGKTYLPFAVISLLSVATSVPVMALDLETARAKGAVGELDNGFLAIPPGAGTEGQSLVTTINSQRKAEYEKIGAQNNITPETVGQMMFEKIYQRLPAGTMVQIQGKWTKKQ